MTDHTDSPQHVLVTGATGQQGGAVARRLLKRGHRVRALTRDPAGAKARSVAELGAEVVAGDLTDPDAVGDALHGVDAVFLVTTPFESSPGEETRQGVTAAERAAKAGVRVVYSSVANADTGTGIPHFDSKAAVERRLAELGGPYSIIAPVSFLENYSSPIRVVVGCRRDSSRCR
jgi:uncharacterized protein YbjT (DUF2867 family)